MVSVVFNSNVHPPPPYHKQEMNLKPLKVWGGGGGGGGWGCSHKLCQHAVAYAVDRSVQTPSSHSPHTVVHDRMLLSYPPNHFLFDLSARDTILVHIFIANSHKNVSTVSYFAGLFWQLVETCAVQYFSQG
jgi:hypothetical protein